VWRRAHEPEVEEKDGVRAKVAELPLTARAAVLALQRSGGNQMTVRALQRNGKPSELWYVWMQVRQCLGASKNKRDMYPNPNPNYPDTDRLIITSTDFDPLKQHFFALQTNDAEYAHLYPKDRYRFEVATSGSAHGRPIHDLKISPIQGIGASGATIFNYHVEVQ
jgi:hypothetical protein